MLRKSGECPYGHQAYETYHGRYCMVEGCPYEASDIVEAQDEIERTEGDRAVKGGNEV